MVSEAVQLSRLTSGESEYRNHDQRDQPMCQESNGRQRNPGYVRATTCLDDGNSGKVLGTSAGDTSGDLNVNFQQEVVSLSKAQG